MTRVHVIRNDSTVPPGLLTAALPAGGVLIALDQGDALPDLGDIDALVLLGGQMGAYDEEDFPYLVAEKDLVRGAVAADIPVLGICLGCQLIADALGGEAYLAPRLEARFEPCHLTEEGRSDPVVGHLAEPVLSLHQDTWLPPPGSRVLATSDLYPQAFRIGSALGIQPHPEVTPEVAREWVDSFGWERIAATGVDPEGLLVAVESGRAAGAATAGALFGGWVGEVAAVVHR